MKAHPTSAETTDQLVERFRDEARRGGRDGVAAETRERLATRLREEGLLDERSIQHLVLGLEPDGDKRVLPSETRGAAVARLMRHYGWDERTAEFTISLSQGWSDLGPEDDDGTPLPHLDREQDDR